MNASPLIETQRVVDAFLPDEPLPDTEETPAGSHKSTQELEVSDVACLVGAKGLIDTVRKSRKRATEFVRFMVEFAAEADERAFEVLRGRVRMWGDPQDLPGRMARTGAPSAVGAARRQRAPRDDGIGGVVGGAPRGLAGSLGGPVRGPGRKALGRPGDQPRGPRASRRRQRRGRAADADRIDAGHCLGGRRIDRVRELATEIREHPEIIDSIEERKIRRTKIQRNQKIGESVEQLLRKELEGCGLTVRRTGIGSDFEVESDFVEERQEVGLELSGGRGTTLIEVKSTRIDQVKMTPAQAKRARALGDGFALCVVPLDDDAPTGETIRAGLRVVFGIGARLESALEDFEFMQDAADVAGDRRGAVELDIREGEVRFRISRAVWGDGLPFGEAVDRFRSRD